MPGRGEERWARARVWVSSGGSLVAEAYARFGRHGGDGLAAGIAFGVLLSVAPLLLVVVAAASEVLDAGSARREVLELVREGLGRHGMALVRDWLDEAEAWSGTATALGLAGFLLGALRFVSIVDAAFEVVFEAPAVVTTWRASLRAFFVAQLNGALVTVVATVVVTVSIVLRSVSGEAIGVVDGSVAAVLLEGARFVASFALLVGAIALLYRTLPPRRLSRLDVIEGALVTATLLEIVSAILGVILDHVDVAAPYGAAGAVVAALVWLLVAAQLFVFGAELTAARADRRARRREAARAEAESLARALRAA